MSRIIRQQDIPMNLRRPYLERYRRILREGLLNPGLSPEQRENIKYKLSRLGKPKDYAHLAGK